MIHELEINQFYKCTEFVNKGLNMEAKAIVAGINPGRIFVDRVDNPRTGLIWQGNNDGFIFVGDAKNEMFLHEIKQYVEDVITVQAKEQGLEWFECIGNNQSWYTVINEVFKDKQLNSWSQNVYRITPGSFYAKATKQPYLDQAFIVFELTEEFLARADLKNMEFIKSKVRHFWRDERQFLQQGIGFCICHGREVANLCITGYRYEDLHGIDIETLKPYQGKKLAQRVVHFFVEACFSKNFEPYWDCMDENHPSNVVAKNIGFIKDFSYKGYEFKL